MFWCAFQKKTTLTVWLQLLESQKDGSMAVESQQPAAGNSWMSLVCFLALAS